MIISVIHKHGIFAFECEGQSPISAYVNRPMAMQVTVQRMQPPSRSIHILCPAGVVEREELQPQSRGMLRLNAGLGAFSKEPLDTLVPEALYHYV
jgi:hypothetical protein